jgi:hypothetical protein
VVPPSFHSIGGDHGAARDGLRRRAALVRVTTRRDAQAQKRETDAVFSREELVRELVGQVRLGPRARSAEARDGLERGRHVDARLTGLESERLDVVSAVVRQRAAGQE